MGKLYQKDVKTINEHIQNIYEEKELDECSTFRKFWIVRQEGKPEVARDISHYPLQPPGDSRRGLPRAQPARHAVPPVGE